MGKKSRAAREDAAAKVGVNAGGAGHEESAHVKPMSTKEGSKDASSSAHARGPSDVGAAVSTIRPGKRPRTPTDAGDATAQSTEGGTASGGRASGAARTPKTRHVNRALRDFLIDHAAEATHTLTREDRLALNCDYFDAMLSLVPAKYYLQGESAEDDAEAAASKYYKKKQGTLPKAAIKSKASKRVRFDVGAAMTVTELQQAAVEEESDAEAEVHAGSKRGRPEPEASEAVDEDTHTHTHTHAHAHVIHSIDDLRARLHARVEELKRNRSSNKPYRTALAESRTDQDGEKRKRRRGAEASDGHTRPDKPRTGSASSARPAKPPSAQPAAKPVPHAKDSDEAPVPRSVHPAVTPATARALDIAFGAIASASSAAGAPAPAAAGRKMNKQERLRSMLETARRKQQHLDKLVAEGKTDAKVSSAFDAAMKRASGEKVHDDPARLAKQLKRLEHKKAKSATKWADRLAKQNQERSSEQTARAEARKTKKIRGLISKEVAKERAKAKEREAAADKARSPAAAPAAAAPSPSKPRAGFEGKKAEFVNKGGH